MSVASDRLAAYLAAETAVLGGQSVRNGNREWTRADLAVLRQGIKELQAQVAAENVAASGGVGLPSFRAGFNPRFTGREGGEGCGQ